MSYERTGWLEGEPARATGRLEIRPAAELGPIIVCLDTSGSMAGARETVAKALPLLLGRVGYGRVWYPTMLPSCVLGHELLAEKRSCAGPVSQRVAPSVFAWTDGGWMSAS